VAGVILSTVVAVVIPLVLGGGQPGTSGIGPSSVTGPSAKSTCGLGQGVRSLAGQAGWGPSRPSFTMKDPAPYATIDAIVDNPYYGDERTFLDSKTYADKKAGSFCSVTSVGTGGDGELVLVRSFLEPSAATNLGGANGVGTAKGVQLRFSISGNGTSLVTLEATVTSANTIPPAIWAGTQISAPWPFEAVPVQGSAIAYSEGHNVRGVPVASTVWTTGAPIGPGGVLDPGAQSDTIVVGLVRVTRIATGP
jgi:hypothetical protein